MTVINWNMLVNSKLSLEGELKHEEGNVQTLKFDSGKERTWLKNSYVPKVYPSLSLLLDNETIKENGKTEYEEFVKWYEVSLRYGILPFFLPRIGYKPKITTKSGEIGIYKFIPESLNFDRLDGIIEASFGLKELGYLAEQEYIFLMTNNGELIQTNDGSFIVT